MAEPFYATREQCARATDVKASAAVDAIIDRLLDAQSRLVERRMHRRFYPLLEAVTIDWPGRGSFWLDADLLSATSITIDAVATTGFVAEPRYGPPYNRLDFSDATITGGDEVIITGLWGYSDDEAVAGALAAAISTTTATTCTVTNAALIGVGDLIHIGAERMIVTGRASATTGTTLSAGVDALASVTTIPVASGVAVNVGETILVDSERMLVTDIAGNNLIVRRAVDGTVLAAHLTSATVYAARLLTITRGAAGTTAITHLISAAITRNVPPGLINELVIAETIAAMQQEGAGWAATAGTGDTQRGITPEGLTKLREQADNSYRRTRIGRAV